MPGCDGYVRILFQFRAISSLLQRPFIANAAKLWQSGNGPLRNQAISSLREPKSAQAMEKRDVIP
jgi:hypothetical protein